MTAKLEEFLAQLYTDAETRCRFLAHPKCEAARAGLSEEEIAALQDFDRVGHSENELVDPRRRETSGVEDRAHAWNRYAAVGPHVESAVFEEPVEHHLDRLVLTDELTGRRVHVFIDSGPPVVPGEG